MLAQPVWSRHNATPAARIAAAPIPSNRAPGSYRRIASASVTPLASPDGSPVEMKYFSGNSIYLRTPRSDGASKNAMISRPGSVVTCAFIASVACETLSFGSYSSL